MSCDVWLCTNGMSEHFLNSFFFFFSFFIFQMQMSYANAMIGLTNALCNHCALICYWWTLNHWPRCQSSMNTNKMWCKSRFLFFDANALFYKNADAKCLYDACVSFHRCNSWHKCLMQGWSLFMTAPAHVFTRDANVSLQRWRCKMSCGANAF